MAKRGSDDAKRADDDRAAPGTRQQRLKGALPLDREIALADLPWRPRLDVWLSSNVLQPELFPEDQGPLAGGVVRAYAIARGQRVLVSSAIIGNLWRQTRVLRARGNAAERWVVTLTLFAVQEPTQLGPNEEAYFVTTSHDACADGDGDLDVYGGGDRVAGVDDVAAILPGGSNLVHYRVQTGPLGGAAIFVLSPQDFISGAAVPPILLPASSVFEEYPRGALPGLSVFFVGNLGPPGNVAWYALFSRTDNPVP